MANNISYTYYPYDVGETGTLGTKVMQDLNDVRTTVNALNGDNFASDTDATITSADITTSGNVQHIRSENQGGIVVVLTSFAGAKWRVKNAAGATLLEVDSSKTVVVGS